MVKSSESCKMILTSKEIEPMANSGLSEAIVGISQNLKNSLEQELEQGLLHDIGFDLDQIKELRAMYKRNILNPSGKIFQELIALVQIELKHTIKKYEERYGKKPEIEDVRRAFSGN